MDIDFDGILCEIETSYDFNQNYDSLKKKYKSNNILTKYEKTKILAERSQQLANGSNTYLKENKFKNTYDIALEELKQKKLPFIIKRKLSNTYEYWKLDDLILLD